jgi:hypothetical protein
MIDGPTDARPKTTRRAFAMRFRILNAFVDRGTMASLGRTDIQVWMAMFRHAKPDRTVRISAGRLAGALDTRRDTIVRSLRRLRDEGLIVRIRRGGQDGTPTTYQIRPFKIDRSPPNDVHMT